MSDRDDAETLRGFIATYRMTPFAAVQRIAELEAEVAETKALWDREHTAYLAEVERLRAAANSAAQNDPSADPPTDYPLGACFGIPCIRPDHHHAARKERAP